MNADGHPPVVGPALHALIVGVSDYPHLLDAGNDESPSHHLGLRKLSTAATAAHRLSRWLMERANRLAVPLGTCRLLLSPSQQEANALAGLAPRANIENFEREADAWRNDARTHPGNVALFYFAGHGLLRRLGSQVLLLEDFGASPAKLLRRCLEASSLVQGMASVSADDAMARTQLYFFDACRTLPAEVLKYDRLTAEEIWDIPLPDPRNPYHDTRIAPMYYTEPGSQAFGIEGVGSVFGEALLRCLQGGAGIFDQRTRKWSVTVDSLNHALGRQLTIINREYQTSQRVRVSELGDDAPLHHLDQAPMVDIEITLDPPERREHAKIFVADENQKGVFDIGAPVPELHRGRIHAGNYHVRTVADARLLPENANHHAGLGQNRILSAAPPSSPWPLFLE